MSSKARGGRKNRKWDRNRVWCANYKNRHQREKNKLITLKKHVLVHINDNCAIRAIENCDRVIRGY